MARIRTFPTQSLLITVVSVCLFVLLMPGCSQSDRTESKDKKEEKKPEFKAPDVAKAENGEDDLKKFLQPESMIKDTLTSAANKGNYEHDARYPSGNLTGACIIPHKQVGIPAPIPLSHLPPEFAVPFKVNGPEAGEVAYFESHAPRLRFPIKLMYRSRNRYGVGLAAVIIRNVKVGRRAPLNRTKFIIHPHSCQVTVPSTGYNGGYSTLGFSPLHDRVQISNRELWDCDLVISKLDPAGDAVKQTGKEFFASKMPKYADKKYPGEYFGFNASMVQPPMIQSPPVREAGLYRISCKRHPFHMSWFWAVDHPYVYATNVEHRTTGMFNFKNVPVGEYEVEVWHPYYKAKESKQKVVIEEDKTTEIGFEFEPPKVMTDPIDMKMTGSVNSWAAIGPFAPKHGVVYPPEKGIDLKAKYKGRADKQIGWSKLEIKDRGGNIEATPLKRTLVNSHAYLHAVLESPKEQPVVFAVHLYESGSLWLNGKLIQQRIAFGYYDHGHMLIGGHLKAGKNSILIKLVNKKHSGRVKLSYRAEGAKPVALPVK